MSDIQRNQWFIVINDNEDKTINEIYDKLEWYLIREADAFYRIIHNKDIKENGELKREHIHLVLELLTRVRKSTLIGRLAKYCEINENQISVEDIRNISKAVQYLIHQNDKSKFQYNVDEIDTNNKERLKYLLRSDEKVSLTTEELFDIIDNARNTRELIKSIGIDLYMKYGRVIDLLWKEKKELSNKKYLFIDE